MVYLLYREISDQTNKSEVVGAYSTMDLAESNAMRERNARTWIDRVPLDEPQRISPTDEFRAKLIDRILRTPTGDHGAFIRRDDP